ncbi:phage holin family protein [Paenibacillus alkalitolerans]|uniref:phage holin family protein n=1 Tax=Paenibacillus alkalitolerans TaxID=2799335 RepID=UPI0018F38398|nr:holin family protein [Paenibacillus alkalitolerans]
MKFETVIKTGVALFGTVTSYLYGGWSQVLGILLFLVIADYLSGFVAAAKEGKLKSTVGLIGIAKKVFIFVIVAVAHQVDLLLGQSHVFRDATIFFYAANEALSILENAGRAGLDLPPKLKDAIEVLRGKGDGKDVGRS